jgi:hypothetical protein
VSRSVFAARRQGLGQASGDVHVLRLVDRLVHSTVSMHSPCVERGQAGARASMGEAAGDAYLVRKS